MIKHHGRLYASRRSAGQPHSTQALLALLLGLVLALGAIPATQAQGTANVLVMPASQTRSVGEMFDVQVVVRDADPFAGVNLEIEFDKQTLEVVDTDPNQTDRQVQPGDMPYPDMVARNVADNEAGTIWYVAAHTGTRANAQGSGTAMTIRFRARAAGTGVISIMAADFSNENGGMLSASMTGGEVIIQAATGATTVATRTPAPTLARGTVLPSATLAPGSTEGQASTRTPLPTFTRSAGQTTPAPTQPGAYPNPAGGVALPTPPANAPLPTNLPAEQYPGPTTLPTQPGAPVTELPTAQGPYPITSEAEQTPVIPANVATGTPTLPSQVAAVIPTAQADSVVATRRDARLNPLVPDEMFLCSSVLLLLLTLALGIYLLRRRQVTP